MPADLAPHHRASLVEESSLSPEIVDRRGYWTAARKADLASLGFAATQQQVPALVVPLFNVYGQPAGYQARPDRPRMKNGKFVKYETPAGMTMVLDVHPSVRHLLMDPRVPLFITEGIKKGDALASRGCCAVALLGVWNWRGTNGLGGKAALSDWDGIALNGRQVYLVFDSDVMLKSAVHEALRRLHDFLATRGAR